MWSTKRKSNEAALLPLVTTRGAGAPLVFVNIRSEERGELAGGELEEQQRTRAQLREHHDEDCQLHAGLLLPERMIRSMKKMFLNKVRIVPDLLWWLVGNAPLLLCLLWFPLTLWHYGTSYPAPARVVSHWLVRILGSDVETLYIALFYLVAIAVGHLVGLAWAIRNRRKEDWTWLLLFLAVTVALSAFAADQFFLCLTALVGILALFGQGIRGRVLLRVCLIIAGIGLSAFLIGAYGASLPAAGQDAVSPADEVLVVACACALPLVLLTGCAVLTARRMRRAA